ncbi:histidine phosphatase superfamily (branch 1) protein [Gregarina niphandrodes]|uniref:Histidine phosphatase superfamily (Branch 1) protein n=1 Tax=Gregarina niphandrodes TaxID=110365 RepID=A0A023BCE5_GRENI|nr:histidine phosphatase superfamily (branch 1) protein [Gregarina niphandrodes]EZG82141.1 histidine phosphatase superfamily (branch 1) protein [Gregarina niphandrodes]|eukprot:XP_011129026.1 histidine phosphatase superfamily (branch 1) protein [Gregarina niphandrodes]
MDGSGISPSGLTGPEPSWQGADLPSDLGGALFKNGTLKTGDLSLPSGAIKDPTAIDLAATDLTVAADLMKDPTKDPTPRDPTPREARRAKGGRYPYVLDSRGQVNTSGEKLLILCRHAQSALNAARKGYLVQPWTIVTQGLSQVIDPGVMDAPLTEQGQEQAMGAGTVLGQDVLSGRLPPVDIIGVSPLRRTLHTTKLIVEKADQVTGTWWKSTDQLLDEAKRRKQRCRRRSMVVPHDPFDDEEDEEDEEAERLTEELSYNTRRNASASRPNVSWDSGAQSRGTSATVSIGSHARGAIGSDRDLAPPDMQSTDVAPTPGSSKAAGAKATTMSPKDVATPGFRSDDDGSAEDLEPRMPLRFASPLGKTDSTPPTAADATTADTSVTDTDGTGLTDSESPAPEEVLLTGKRILTIIPYLRERRTTSADQPLVRPSQALEFWKDRNVEASVADSTGSGSRYLRPGTRQTINHYLTVGLTKQCRKVEIESVESVNKRVGLLETWIGACPHSVILVVGHNMIFRAWQQHWRQNDSPVQWASREDILSRLERSKGTISIRHFYESCVRSDFSSPTAREEAADLDEEDIPAGSLATSMALYGVNKQKRIYECGNAEFIIVRWRRQIDPDLDIPKGKRRHKLRRRRNAERRASLPLDDLAYR